MFASAQVLRLRVLLVAGLFAVTSSIAAAQSSAFTTIDAPGAATGAQQGTVITAINAAGDVTGFYLDASNVIHGFVLPAGGTIQTFNVSAAGTSAGQGTFPASINSSGVIAGGYTDSINAAHGFVRAANGTITIFDAPLAPTSTKDRGTVAMGINDSGVIVGFYSTGTYTTNSVYHGFQRLATSPYTITTIDAPNAGTGDGPGFKQGTQAYGINASGQIVGSYTDSNFYHHGFLLSGTTYTVIDPPGTSTTQCINTHGKNFGGTSADSIDAAGDVAGHYLDTTCAQHGFVHTAGGTYTSLDAAGADTSVCSSTAGMEETFCGTGLLAVLMDSVGDITGGYVDSNGIIHGFVRPAETGIITSFSDPSAATTGSLSGTIGTRIVSSASGITIVGTYADTNTVLHGFIYTLALTATTTTLTPVPTPNPSIFGEPVTLSASVSSSGGTPSSGETVTFMSGTTSLGTATLTSGAASLTTTSLPVGTDSITAVYSGDSDFAGSTSTAVSQTVNKASSTTTLTSSANPSNFGQSATITAAVSGQYGGVATGSVTFSNGSTSLGSVSLSGDSAVLVTTALPVGTDSITAVYSGDSNFAGSTSNTLSQVVAAVTSNNVNITGAGTGSNQGTIITGIDTAGDISGFYIDSNNLFHGFVLPVGGTSTTFNVTGAGTGIDQGTYTSSMDAAGNIAGYYINAATISGIGYQPNVYFGFVRAASGTITPIIAPNALGTKPIGINATAGITGSWEDTSRIYHGFVSSLSGVIFSFDAPGAGTVNPGIASYGTAGIAINTAGTIAGKYVDANGISHGFARTVSGSFTMFDVTGAATSSCPALAHNNCGTFPLTIDTAGDIAGTYIDSSGVIHGFYRSASGTITSFDAPGAATTPGSGSSSRILGTAGMSIDDSGNIAGTYIDADGVGHGFQRIANGTVTSFDAPGAGTTGSLFAGTGVTAINAAGTIVGSYTDTNAAFHGYIYTPSLTATTTTLTPVPTPNPSIFGESVTLTASVSSSGGTPPNGETVTFMSGTTSLGTAALSSGVASLTSTALPTGTDSITAVYGGDLNFISSTSTVASQVVDQASTSTTLKSSLNPSNFGQSVNLTAAVSGQFGGVATGTVMFSNGSTSLGTVSLSGGSAVLATTTLPVGTNSITAVYTGDSNFAGSTSTAVSQTVTKASSTTTLTSSMNPSNFGQSVNLTATESGQYGGVAAGSVTFSNGSTSLGTVSLSGGSAVLTTTTLPVGTNTISAVYSGDSNFTGSSPNSLTQTVNKASSSTALVSSLNPSASGASVTLTATVSGQFGGTATGSVAFSNGSTSLGSISLSSGSAGLTTTTLPVGTDPITAVYSGDTNFTGSTSNSVSQVVVVPNPVPVIGSVSPAFTDAGGAAFTLTVNGSGFVSGSTVYWGTTALTTTYVSSSQLTASVTPADIASAGTDSITVQTLTPGGGTSNPWQFEVDSASGSSTAPTFTSTTATVSAGSTASYPVTLPSGVTSATVTCLNLPTGATCSYSSGTVTIATTSATHTGTYLITVVFTETVSGAATAWILLPILLLPLVFLRRKLTERGVWVTACLALVLLAGATAFSIGCGGGGSSSTPPPQTHQVVSAGSVTLTIH